MTPEEFAEAHGLSVEEATYVLSRRAALAETGDARIDRARSILALSQKRVGVHPVVVTPDGLEKGYDPDADVGKGTFYGKKGFPNPDAGHGAADGFGGDEYKDWEEPP